MAEIRIQANGKKSLEKKIGGKNVAFLFNGERRSSTVAKKKHPKNKKGKKPGRNPFMGRGKGKHGSRNPLTERGGMSGDLATGAGVVTSVVVAELVEEKVFPSFNSGIGGFFMDAAICAGVGFVGSVVGQRFGLGRNFLKGSLYGAAAKITVRALQDLRVSPANAIQSAVRQQQSIQAANGAAQQPAAGTQMGRPGTWNVPLVPTYRQLPDGSFAPPSLGRPAGRNFQTRQLVRR